MAGLVVQAWCLALLGPGLLTGLGGQAAEAPSADRDLPPDAEQAIENGIQFLIRTQSADGSWLSDGTTGRYPAAITALAGMALLANGSTCYSGEHAANVRGAVDYLLQHADPETGLIGGQEAGRPMFGHGFAMLFLAQAYGSAADAALQRSIRSALSKAVELTARTQADSGGWYYTPTSTEDEGAVTVCQMQGLRACANAGIAVPARTVERAMSYIRHSANPDGGIAYRGGVPGPSRPGITCAALATMYAAGLYEDDLVENALRYALANTVMVPPSPTGGTHFYYSHMYLSQVLYFRGGQQWEDYFGNLRHWLLQVQGEDGSWQGEYTGRAYGTACALLILQLPYNNLPVLQR